MGWAKAEMFRRQEMAETIVSIIVELGLLPRCHRCKDVLPEEIEEEDAREVYKVGIGRFKRQAPPMSVFHSREEVQETIHNVLNNISDYVDDLCSCHTGPIAHSLYRDRDRD